MLVMYKTSRALVIFVKNNVDLVPLLSVWEGRPTFRPIDFGRKALDENLLDENRLDENWAHGLGGWNVAFSPANSMK